MIVIREYEIYSPSDRLDLVKLNEVQREKLWATGFPEKSNAWKISKLKNVGLCKGLGKSSSTWSCPISHRESPHAEVSISRVPLASKNLRL